MKNIARIKDLTGQKYHNLTFIYPDENDKKKWYVNAIVEILNLLFLAMQSVD